MKAQREDYTQAIERLQSHLKSFSKGDRITYEEVGRVIGFEYGSAEFKYITSKFRRQAARDDLKVTIKCDRGVGFVVMTDDEALRYTTVDACKTVRRHLKRRRKYEKTVDEKNLSDVNRRLFHAGRQATREICTKLSQSVNTFTREALPTRPLPK